MRRISLRFSFLVIMTGIKDRDRKRKAKRLNTLLLLILSAHICICEYNRQSAVTKKSFFFYFCGGILYNKRVNGTQQ